jgi:hypothetical protein
MDSTEDTYDDSFIPSSFEPFDPLFAFDDAGVAFDNLAEDPAFPVSWEEEEEKGTLYSTPLSWEPPEPKFEPLPIVSLQFLVALFLLCFSFLCLGSRMFQEQFDIMLLGRLERSMLTPIFLGNSHITP